MQVFVYPEIWCKHENGRWVLLAPRAELIQVTELTGELRRAVEQITRQIPRQDGVFHVPGFLWKRVDGYFHGTRYNPATIIDYHHFPNPGFSVDAAGGQDVEDSDGVFRKKYCGPDEERPPPSSEDDPPGCPIPQFESQRVDVIVLEPVEVRAPTEKVVPTRKLKKGDEQ